jgi:SAM-dependent methyltransferase
MSRMKRFIGSAYSFAADRFYDPVVVHGGFKLFGGNLNHLAIEQGRRAVELAAGEPILDMPVGTAFFTVKLATRHPGLVVGSDIATGMVIRAKEVASEAATPNLKMVQADGHHLPFPDGAFAAVMCTNGLQVIPGLRPTISELARVTKPGGTLFISVLTVPAPRAVRVTRREKLPTIMLSGRDIADVVEDNDMKVTSLRRERLATLIEAEKPAGASVVN